MNLLRLLQSWWSTSRVPIPGRTQRAARGSFGEDRAAEMLRRAGMKILVRNWRSGRDEIDLVCRDQDTLVFVEVKTRDEYSRVSGYHSVNARKKRALRRACRAYLQSMPQAPPKVRFDIVEVRLCHDGTHTLQHFRTIPLLGHRP